MYRFFNSLKLLLSDRINPDRRPTHAQADPIFFTTAWPIDLIFFPILISSKILLLPQNQDPLTEGKIEAYTKRHMKTLQNPF